MAYRREPPPPDGGSASGFVPDFTKCLARKHLRIATEDYATRAAALATLMALAAALKVFVAKEVAQELAQDEAKELVAAMIAVLPIPGVDVLAVGAVEAVFAEMTILELGRLLYEKAPAISAVFSCAYAAGMTELPTFFSEQDMLDVISYLSRASPVTVPTPIPVKPQAPPITEPVKPVKKGMSTGNQFALGITVIGVVAAVLVATKGTSSNPSAPPTAPTAISTISSWKLAPCRTSTQGYITGLWNCQGTVTALIQQPISTTTVSVGLDFPSNESFFHGQISVPAGFTGTVTIPISNEYEGKCVTRTVTAQLDVQDGPAGAPVAPIASETITVHWTCH